LKTIEIEISLESILNREYPVYQPSDTKTIDLAQGCESNNIDISLPEIFEDNPAYGTIDVSYVHFSLFLAKTCDDMGFFSDFDFIPLAEISGGDISYYYRLPQLDVSSYYSNVTDEYISGYTLNYLTLVTSYDANNPYIENLNLAIQSNSFTGVLTINSDYIIYVINGEIDMFGNYIENTGLVLTTYFAEILIYFDSILKSYVETPITTFKCKKSGWSSTNISLYQNVKEEQYFGQVFPEEENYDVSIDRNNLSVLEPSLRLAEIATFADLILYNRKYYNL